MTVPTGLLRAIAPINDRSADCPACRNLRETIAAAPGVTSASHDKAARELGFAPRALEQGIADTFGRGRLHSTDGSRAPDVRPRRPRRASTRRRPD